VPSNICKNVGWVILLFLALTVKGNRSRKKKPLMNADKRRYLNLGFASAFIGVHLRLLAFPVIVARGSLAP